MRPGAIRPGEERPARVPTETPEVFKVPRVVDRPLDVDAGEKIVVSKFNLVGAVDRPEQKITVAEVQALVDKKKAERPEGFTVGRLQEVAGEVTKYYRGKGLILAQAFIPVQDVQNGEVNIQILEGTLGRVVFEGNKTYSTSTLEKPFADLIGKPVTKEAVEAALLHLTDYPGLGLFGVFQPGQQVGAADMVVKVQQEKRVGANVRYDNYGLRETGVRRGRVEMYWNNPFDSGDKISFTGQLTHVPMNLGYWGIDYETKIFGPATRFESGINENTFDVGGAFADQKIHSVTDTFHVAFARSFIRSRQMNIEGRIGLDRKSAVTTRRDIGISDDELAVLTAGVDFDNVDTRFSGLDSAQLEFGHGLDGTFGAMGDQASVNSENVTKRSSRRGRSGNFAPGDFNKINFTGSRLQSLAPLGKLFNKPDLFKGQSLLLRAEAQYSPDLLVPLEQYAVGGPNNVRAYQPTEKLFDKALFFSVEYIINAPGIADKPAFGGHTWGELLQLSFFYDVAFGRLNDALPNERASENLKGAGLSLSYNNPGGFSTRLTIANRLGGPRPVNGRLPQVWIDLNYPF